jgi:hypothetical protein
MKVQGFIFNWKGHEADARALEEKIGKIIQVTVINSEEQLEDKYPEWVHLDDSAYFSAQWNKAVELFDADIFFHLQADAEFDQFDALFKKAELVYERYKFGVYEPDVDFTELEWKRECLLYLDSHLVEVPVPECTCWFIDGKILRMLPPVDVSINHYGWGIPSAIGALSWINGRPCIRDYNFKVKHPQSRNYANQEANRQLQAYINGLEQDIQKEIFTMRMQLATQLNWGEAQRNVMPGRQAM